MKEKALSVHCVNLCDPCGKNFNREKELNRKEHNEIKEIRISSFTESKFFFCKRLQCFLFNKKYRILLKTPYKMYYLIEKQSITIFFY